MAIRVWALVILPLCAALQSCGAEQARTTDLGDFLQGRVSALIGETATAESAYLFGSIRAVASDERGRIYVADAASSQVRVFSPDGQHLETIGREGQGPGEFQVPLDLLVDGDALWVRDISRVTQFAPRAPGMVPDSVVETLLLPGRATAAFRRGRLVDGTYYSPSYHYPFEGGASFFYEGLIGAAEIDTVGVPALPNMDRIRGTAYRGGRVDAVQRRLIESMARAPFEPAPAWDLTSKGTIIAGTGRGTLQEFDASGAILNECPLPFPPRSVTQTEQGDSLASLRARLDSLTVPIKDIENVSSHVLSAALPGVLPDYIGVYVSADDLVWVQLWPRPDTSGTSEFLVFDSAAELIAMVSFPVTLSADVQPHFIGGRMVGVVEDEITGVQRVVVAEASIPM